jgi:two-component system CheB/CheR fusion protein
MTQQQPNPDATEEQQSGQIDDLIPSHGYARVPVVGLGGSAGSIEALQSFFGAMPADSGIAFAVVIHLSPEHDSMLAELIQRCTRMPVVKVQRRVKIVPDTVYVIPPGKALRSEDGYLHLADFPAERTRQVAVDIFLRGLADSHGPHAAAVVLSGVDGDGAIGVKRIKERGGLTVAQDPGEALHSGMPRSAIQTGMVDWVLRVADMPARLLSYFHLERQLVLPREETEGKPPAARAASESELREVLSFLRTRTGRDFSHYKRGTIVRRIARRMQVNGVDNLPAYLKCLRTLPGECGALLQDLLISVTNFFRDPDCFAALQGRIPSLFEGKGPADTVRAWVVACATGEEAYSIAILLSEYASTLASPPMLQVFATDLDEDAIQTARDGVYPTAILADVNEDRLRRFFVKDHRGYRVRRELREVVLFAHHDVLNDSPFSRLDLVTCRNLLIYLGRQAQARLLDTLHFALLPGGTLMLGASEAVDEASALFSVADKKHRIYVQRPVVRRAVPVPTGYPSLKLSLEGGLPSTDLPALPAGHAVEVTAAGAARPRELPRGLPWGDVHLRLLEQLAPPSVLANGDYDILHLSATAGRFLQLAGGEPSRNLLHSVAPACRLVLRSALHQATQGGQPVELPVMPLEVSGGTTPTVIRVTPMLESDEALFLVTFDDRGAQQPAGPAVEKLVLPPADPLASHLDREIERLKQGLRETVEQYEASTEELKASNEELQAMNEELRAATEELETSREELQSINEELTTVNAELKSNVEQLSHANSDMQNLMDATAIATVFVDRELRIMRYTPGAVSLFNLIVTDVGRPLTDLATQLDYPQLGDDARRVLEKLIPVEREVGQANGSWYLARLMPYRTLDDRIAGLVFTFIDITERKQAEEMRRWLSAVVNSTSDAIISFALDRKILSWNSGAERIFGYSAQDAIGQPLDILVGGEESDQQLALDEIAEGRAVENLETVRKRRDGSRIHVSITVSPIRDEAGHVLAGTAVVRDVTAARESAEALRLGEERLRLVLENAVEYAIFSTDLDRRITIWNAGAQRLLGFAEQEAMGQSADVIFTAEDRAAGAPQKEAEVALREGRARDEREHQRKDGSRFPASGAMMLMRNGAGEAVGFLKILRDVSQRLPETPV